MKNPLGTNRFEGKGTNEAWSSESTPQEPTRIEVVSGVENEPTFTELEQAPQEEINSSEVLPQEPGIGEKEAEQISSGLELMAEKQQELADQVLRADLDWTNGGVASNVVEVALPKPKQKSA